MTSSRSELDLRLAVPAVVACVSAWCAVGDPTLARAAGPGLLVLAGVLLVCAALVDRERKRGTLRRARRGWVWVLAASALSIVVAGLVCQVVEATDRSRHPEALRTAEIDTVEVTVTSSPRRDEHGRIRFDARVTSFGDSTGLFVPVEARIASGGIHPEPMALGERYRGSATLTAADEGEHNAYSLVFDAAPQRSEIAPWYLAWTATVHRALSAASQSLPEPGSELIPGLATGEDGGVSRELREAMRASGLSHLTAVSGANCAIVMVAMTLLVQRLGGARAVRVVAALGALALFVVLVSPTPSVLRASLMCALAVLLRFGGRSGAGAQVLLLTAILLVCADPWLTREYGFALSVAATAGLIFTGPMLATTLARVLPAWLASAISVPVSAQLWCQPILILLRPEIAWGSVPANLLVALAAPVATVMGLLGALLGAVWAPLGFPFIAMAWVAAAWIATVAQFFASSAPTLPWFSGLAGLVAAVIGAAVVVLGFSARSRRVRRTSACATAVAVAVWASTNGGAAVVGVLTRPARWDLVACDVGQGDAVLIRSGGRTALVDTGPEPAALRRCLDLVGVETIDLLVLSHYDRDHAGGLAAVAGRVSTALVGPVGRASDQDSIDMLRRSGVEIATAAAPENGRLGQLDWRILWPERGETTAGNSSSITIEFCSAYCALFLGDLNRGAQREIAPRVREVDLVKVAHHGSADQFPTLYDHAHASMGIVSVGAENEYGHPTSRTLQMLDQDGTMVFRTDQRGTVLFEFRDGAWTVWSEHR